MVHNLLKSVAKINKVFKTANKKAKNFLRKLPTFRYPNIAEKVIPLHPKG